MKFAAAALVSLGLSGAHALVDIPAVSSVVSSALSEYSIYVTHALNPTATATKTPAKATNNVDILARGAVSDPAYWLAGISHRGVAAFNSNPSTYTVFRNVKDYGAKGDGVTDDTAAINAAISAGGRIGPSNGQTSTTTPAIVYFPAGTYIISSSIIDYYFTQLIGNPNDLPVLKASANFPSTWIIDGDQYQSTGNQGWGSTNVFYRQIRNFVLDLTAVPPTVGATGIHWPTAQATTIQNVKILMSSASGTQHQGIFIENGSGGFMSDVTTVGGAYGLNIGSQQFTMRGLTISNAVVGINQIWNWGWTYQGLNINNCGTAISISNGGIDNQAVGSVVILDSTIQNTSKFVDTAYTSTSYSNGSLWLENIQLSNVATAVQDNGNAILAGSSGSMTISGWGQGHSYSPSGPHKFQGPMEPASRPSALLASGTSNYLTQSKPQYEASPVASFLSVRAAGAKGDGQTDDTAALNAALQSAAASNQLLYIDQGTYVVSDTLMVPAGSRIVGEAYPVLLATGSNFANINQPKAVVQIGNAGDSGLFQWSDTIVGTRGSTPGAILVEWNLAATAGSGMWDVHSRIGGFAGSNLQVQQCPTTTAVSSACEAAYMSLWVRSSAKNVYLENVWLWTADHDMDSPANTQISVYTGRGLLVEGSNIWLYGTAVEHHSLYQYQFSGASNIVAGFIQTETPYWQPNPDAAHGPYSVSSSLRDPVYTGGDAFGLRILDTQQISIYGAGLYSFFNNYIGTCSAYPTPENCQAAIFSIEGSTSGLKVFALSTVGTINQVIQDGTVLALASDNLAAYAETIAYLAPAAGTGSNSTTTSLTTSISSTMTMSGSTTLATSVSSKSATSTAPVTTGWALVGCYTDNVSERALPSGIPVPGGASKMTVEACQAGCQALGFTLAGLEYAGECYCGNQVQGGNGPAPDGNAQCNMACNGDSTETCGGPNRLDLYTYGRQTATTAFTTTATASSTVSTVSATSGTASATSTSGATGWVSLGCYTDNISERALPSGIPVPGGASKMTVEACQAGCQALGFTFAGVEYADECYCGNQVQGGNGPAPDGNAQCNMACTGASSETCGGPNRLNLYQYTSSTTPVAKRGLAYNNNNPQDNAMYTTFFAGNSKISWGYDWGFPSNGLPSAWEFVPMLWGLPSGADPDWTAAVKTADTKHILGFNEPDLIYSASSNILPAAAAQGYMTYMQPFAGSVKIGMPSVLWNNVGSSSGGNYNTKQWTNYFLGNCTSCTLDFGAIHWYQDCNAAWFKGNVTDAHATLNLPIWVTEFQCYGTDAQQIAFLQDVLPWMDSQPYVERYAYFGVFPGYLLNSDGTALSDIGKAYASA